jgi:hypothetical protein
LTDKVESFTERSDDPRAILPMLVTLMLVALGIAAMSGVLWRYREGIGEAARDGASAIGARIGDLTSGDEFDDRGREPNAIDAF